ncbi:hypothetical protein Tco_0919081, partial [Tanacetum coccineum]
MIEPEVPLKRKDQIALDEQIARDIQAKLDAELLEEQKLARKQEEEANIALIESWENTQAMMEADRLLAERLQSKEREELTDEEKAKLFMELMEKRRKHFAALLREHKKRETDLLPRHKRELKCLLILSTWESKEKKEEGREETTKVEEEKESQEVNEIDEAELKKLLVIKRDEDIAIDAITLATKLPVSVAPKVGAAAVASPAGVLELDTHSSSKADPLESSPPSVYVTPMVSHFLCSNDLESDTEMPEMHVSPTPHDAMLTRWRSRVASRSSSPTTSTPEIPIAPILPAPSAIVTPSSEFPLAPALTARKSVRPLPSHRFEL